MRVARLLVVGVLAAGVACSSSTYGGGGGVPTPNQVFMQNTAFNPTPRIVPVGTTVTWVNKDGVTHTTSSSPGSAQVWDMTVGPGASTAVMFSAAGMYPYHCNIHPGMQGTIVVQ